MRRPCLIEANKRDMKYGFVFITKNEFQTFSRIRSEHLGSQKFAVTSGYDLWNI